MNQTTEPQYGLIFKVIYFLATPFLRRIRPVDPQPEVLRGFYEEGQVIYVTQVVSFVDFMILNYFLQKHQLPRPDFTHGISPFLVMPFKDALNTWLRRRFKSREEVNQIELGLVEKDILGGKTGHVFLKCGPRSFYKLPYYYHGIFSQMARYAENHPVHVVPTSIFMTRRRPNEERSLFDVFFGTYDIPGRLRKAYQFLHLAMRGRLVFSKPVDLSTELAKERFARMPVEKLEKRLRWVLLFHLDNEDRAYRGPTKRSTLRKVRRILRERRLRMELEKVAQRQNRSIDTVMKEAKKELHHIASDTSEKVINGLRILFDIFWARSLEGFDIDRGDLRMVRELNKKGPVVFIPCHRSHADYCLFAYLFEKRGLNTPRFAAGENLAKWPLGPVLRRAGAFFIRRSFKGESIFPLVFEAYIRYILRNKYILTFFMEGTRSRTGKLLQPKIGLLAMILDAWQQGVIDDVPLVPVTIDYGKIFEGQSYLREKGGHEKQAENLSSLLKTRKFFFRKHGIVRLRFSQPISLVDYVQERDLTRDALTMRVKLPLLQDLGQDIMAKINRGVTLTAANIIAGILMGFPGRGITVADLKSQFIIAVRYLRQRRVELSFPDQDLDRALQDSLETFMQWETIVQTEVGGEKVVSVPEGKRSEMEYYKNNGMHFILDLCLFSFAMRTAPNGTQTLKDLHAKSKEVFDMLSLEFVMDRGYPGPRTVEYAFKSLESMDAVVMEGDRVQATDLKFGQQVMATCSHHFKNFFESYFVVAEQLLSWDGPAANRKEFLKQAMAKSKLLYAVGTLTRIESVNKVSFDNALTKFQKLNMIQLKSSGKDQKYPLVELKAKKREDLVALRQVLLDWMKVLD